MNVAKAADAEIAEAYARLGSVWKAAESLGMCGQSVHERLVKLGVSNPPNVWAAEEVDRIKREYVIYRDAGRLEQLADSMGRPKTSLCRQARILGLTDKNTPRPYIAVWKYLSLDAAEVIWDDFKRSSLGLKAYCQKKGWDDLGFSKKMRELFADEYEHVIELKHPKSTMYRLGRAFEYVARDNLKARGYFVMRSPASRSPIDLLAVKTGTVLFVQCKRGGSIGVAEWNTLYDLAASVGALPVMAERHVSGRGVTYWLITEKKDGSKRRQPMVSFDPDQPGR